MSLSLPVKIRIESIKNLIGKIQILMATIDLVDDEARDHLRQEMIEEISYVYGTSYVDAVSRYNDLVKGIDQVDPDWRR